MLSIFPDEKKAKTFFETPFFVQIMLILSYIASKRKISWKFRDKVMKCLIVHEMNEDHTYWSLTWAFSKEESEKCSIMVTFLKNVILGMSNTRYFLFPNMGAIG